MKVYDKKQTLKRVTASLKIDGVQLVVENGIYSSRAGKPLFNIPCGLSDGIYEIFLGNFEKSMSACRTKQGKRIDFDDIYSLYPYLDERLNIGFFETLSPTEIETMMQKAKYSGFEGLVLREEGSTFENFKKVKPTITIDAMIIGINSKNGKLESFTTKYGKVGTGFTLDQKSQFLCFNMIGYIVEVECMELTAKGQFRQPRFVRLREDLFCV